MNSSSGKLTPLVIELALVFVCLPVVMAFNPVHIVSLLLVIAALIYVMLVSKALFQIVLLQI